MKMVNIISFKKLKELLMLSENEKTEDVTQSRSPFDEAWERVEQRRKENWEKYKEIEAKRASQDRMSRAAEWGNLKMYKKLKEEGVDINQVSSMGEHPLVIASAKGNTDFVRAMLEDGVDPDVDQYRNGKATPLIAASGPHHKEVMELLISAGADPNAVMKNGYTPLKMARSKLSTDKEPIKILLNAGADPFSSFKNVREVLDFFDGDISWWHNYPPEFSRIVKTRRVFGK